MYNSRKLGFSLSLSGDGGEISGEGKFWESKGITSFSPTRAQIRGFSGVFKKTRGRKCGEKPYLL